VVPLAGGTARTRLPGGTPGAACRWRQKIRLPTPRPYGPHSRRARTGEGGNRPQQYCGNWGRAVPRAGQNLRAPALLLAEVGRASLGTLFSSQAAGASFESLPRTLWASRFAVPVLQVLHMGSSSTASEPLGFAPGLLGAPSESPQVRGVGHPARGHLKEFWLPSRSP
jgi:hypothetical protein